MGSGCSIVPVRQSTLLAPWFFSWPLHQLALLGQIGALFPPMSPSAPRLTAGTFFYGSRPGPARLIGSHLLALASEEAAGQIGHFLFEDANHPFEFLILRYRASM